MNNNLKISQLLFKLKEDSINAEELEDLLHFLKKPELQLDEYLKDAWEGAQPYDGMTSSEAMLAKIHFKIDYGDKKPRINVEKENFYRVGIRSFMRYAAVFVLALGMFWMGNSLFFREKSVPANISQMNEISVAYGSKSRIVLPDGSIVNLNSGSLLQYASDFENERKVYIEGEAFFDVKKDPRHPFLVQTSNITIRVLGTVFNVKSYPEEEIIETTLVSGSVQILAKSGGSKDEFKTLTILKPNEKAIFYKNSMSTEKESSDQKTEINNKDVENIQVQKKIKTELYTAWKDNNLVFNNEQFGNVVPKLERWFNIEIENNFPELNASRLTGKFDTETIEQALEALRIITPFNYSIEKNKITIYK
jgi:ferric-dicitrate binding protein FerR (iron transport regulator)